HHARAARETPRRPGPAAAAAHRRFCGIAFSIMARIVQKYGGTSVGDVERIKKVAERIKATRDEGNEVVVVVSARSGVTNELLARAKAVCEFPNERELDM